MEKCSYFCTRKPIRMVCRERSIFALFLTAWTWPFAKIICGIEGRKVLLLGLFHILLWYDPVEPIRKPLFYIIGRPSPHAENRVANGWLRFLRVYFCYVFGPRHQKTDVGNGMYNQSAAIHNYIELYQKYFSGLNGTQCKMYRTCSQYSMMVFTKHPFPRAMVIIKQLNQRIPKYWW